MPTNTSPIQLDEFPEKWSARAANRVLESAISRMSDASASAAETTSSRPSATREESNQDKCCTMLYAFGPWFGRGGH
jgi:hypothetical protein